MTPGPTDFPGLGTQTKAKNGRWAAFETRRNSTFDPIVVGGTIANQPNMDWDQAAPWCLRT